jgi:3-oxoadipate enol-lactonase
MPFVAVAAAKIHYQLDGPPAAPVLLFSNSLGTNLSMWDRQIPALASRFRVLRYDTRGHAQSSVSPGPYSIELLGRDVVSLLDALKIDRAHYCGLSLGGLIGLSAVLQSPARFRSLTICNSAAKIGSADAWNRRIATVTQSGMASVAAGVVERWFTPEFIARHADVVAPTRQMLLEASPQGYAACCAALRDADLREAISAIALPTLVIAGSRDSVIPVADARLLAYRIPAARYIELDAAHLSNVEAAADFNSALLAFLADSEAA